MTQNLLSRIFGGGSIYETLAEDAESVAGGYHTSQSTYSQSQFGMSFHPYAASAKSRANFGAEQDDGVPESLLYEGGGIRDDEDARYVGPSGRPEDGRGLGLPPRPEETSPGWQHQDAEMSVMAQRGMISAKDRALWKWANIRNLDVFLQEVYGYFLGNGIYSILLSRALNLLTLAFVTSFSTYLMACIDYSKVRSSTSLPQIQVDRCMAKLGNTPLTILWLLTMFWFIKLFQYISDVRLLWDMHNFYLHLLDVTETDMQTISWQDIVNRLLVLRDSNPITSSENKHSTQSRERMDAHDIANRIMRKENYLVAMFNKEILDLTIPLPLLQNRPLLTRTLEWNLSLCILAYVFDEQGQVRPAFVRESGPQRKSLIDGLKRRFLFAGIMNALFAPFIIIYLLLIYFFRYFSEYHKNPSTIGSRQYTPYAQWKFREFNELFHIFQKRLNLSHPYANKYVSQFPNDKTMQLARFASFVAGSFAAVLALASVIDPDLFLGFEITHDRTVLFYLGLFGTIVAVSRSMVPEDTHVFDPEASLLEVTEYTHYAPAEWSGKYHSHEIKAEFCKLYDYKLMIFIQEILSVVVTPLILWFTLPACSEKIIDFVKDFTVHVDGIGYVCSFALFDFSKNGNTKYGAPVVPSTLAAPASSKVKDMVSNDGKMEKSFLNFKASNPDWIPDQSGSLFLQSLQSKAIHAPVSPIRASRPAAQSGQHAAAFPPRSPVRTYRRPPHSVGNQDSYAAQSLRARRGMDSSVTMKNSVYSPNVTRMPVRISEEMSAVLGESFLDTTTANQNAAATHTKSDGMESDVGAGVLGLMHQFYQEAGTKGAQVQ